VPFDLRPLGYSPEDVRAFLRELSPGGRAFYLDVQHRLDLAFPALLAATLSWMALRLPPPGWRGARGAVVVFAAGGMVADYLENAQVAAMLTLAADTAPAELIASASRFTLMKSLGATVALSLGVVLLIRALVFRMHSKQPMDSPS
jgi:hypothetical protein